MWLTGQYLWSTYSIWHIRQSIKQLCISPHVSVRKSISLSELIEPEHGIWIAQLGLQVLANASGTMNGHENK
jgi:hypothetical protein